MASEEHTSLLRQVLAIWRRACIIIDRATMPEHFDDGIDRLSSISAAIRSWPDRQAQQRYKLVLLLLLSDTMIWAQAKRDGWDVAATRRDMDEAYTIVCAETERHISAA
jgi:hypothetical protein